MNAMPMRIALQSKSPIELFGKEYKTMQRYRRAYEKRKFKKIKINYNRLTLKHYPVKT